jgi:hypothetical protein
MKRFDCVGRCQPYLAKSLKEQSETKTQGSNDAVIQIKEIKLFERLLRYSTPSFSLFTLFRRLGVPLGPCITSQNIYVL